LGNYSHYYNEKLYDYYKDYIALSENEIYKNSIQNSYIKVLGLLSRYKSINTILDVGCGMGEFVYAAKKLNYNVIGIEYSKNAVKNACRFNLPVYQKDFFSTDFNSKKYDLITFFEVLEHVSNPFEFLKRANDLLTPNGLIYITTPNFNSLEHLILKNNWNVLHREHISYFNKRNLIKLISNINQLEIVYIETRNISMDAFYFIYKKLCIFKKYKKNDAMKANLFIQDKSNDSVFFYILKKLINYILNFFNLGSTFILILKKIDN
jgi:2-polyprenyl-3-methyl-5-hydroxy-6-metoxy-1,4-benzoquinol methylase